MKILFLQLSDIHIEKRKDEYDINIEKIIDAINMLGSIDECVIVISGDITKNGKENEFKIAEDMLGNLINKLKSKKFKEKHINVLTVPGNHDLQLNDKDRTFDDITKSFKNKNIDTFFYKDVSLLKNFYKFAKRNKCFCDNKIVSHNNIIIGNQKINFALINTAIFSLLGSANEDMGIHYLRDEDISSLEIMPKNGLNVIVMHHSTEWFSNNVKEKIQDIINDKFPLIFEGHEHDGFGEDRKLNNRNSVAYMQGNSLSGDKRHKKGFNTLVYDTSDKSANGFSFTWNHDYYKGTKILDMPLIEKGRSEFINTEDFKNYLKEDDNQKIICEYFVFPLLSYDIINENNELETKNINDGNEFIKVILENPRTVISGDSRFGKTTLAKYLYKKLIDNEQQFIPIMLVSEDLKNKKINKIIEYAFNDQYEKSDNTYDKFLQLDKEKRILIIDDAGKIKNKALEKMLNYYDDMFNEVVFFSEEKIDLNIGKQVIDTLTEKNVGKISIKPFFYDRRKMLISKVCDSAHLSDNVDDKKKLINELNNIISSQAKYFILNPEFIINFVKQYTQEFEINFSTENNVFNIVYENSIKSKIINNSQPSDVNNVFNIMEEIAYYMHFGKKSWITSIELSKIITKYNNEFRQKVKIATVLNVGRSAKLIIEKDLKIRLRDNNLLSYFVAQALNKKCYYEDEHVKDKIEYLLSNLCFGINSDIVLFMALITSNPEIINVILECANKHFKGIEELNFDANNVPFLCESNFDVKNTMPDEKEKKEKENEIIKYEKEINDSEIIELVDKYSYKEEEASSTENQLIKSIKYLEILSKILPAFCHNMRASQQDKLVKALYRYPNCFIYQLFHDINDSYKKFIEQLFEKISEIRKEKNIAELNIKIIKNIFEQMSISVVISLYQLVASTATTEQTIAALEAFNFKDNSNYSIINLMMNENIDDIKQFSCKAIKIYNESELKIVKSMVRYTVRNYFLDHDVKLIRESQALLDKFFGSSDTFNNDKKMIKSEITKNKLRAS